AQFFAYALVDEHVGVDGHAQGQSDGGDARQRQGGLQDGQQRQQQQDVERQPDGGEDAEQVVVDDDEQRDCQEAVQRGIEALGDVLGAQAGADGAFFDDFHGRGQRAGAQQQGDVGGFLGGHAAGDLDLAAGDFAADDRRGDDLA